MKKIMALSKGTGEMFRILWQSGRGLTVMLVVNSLIRNALWPVRALVVKDMVDLAAASWGQGSAAWQGNFMLDAALFFACFCANRVWWPLNSYVQTLLLARLGHESRVRIMAAMNGVGLSFFDCAENRDIYERALRQADDRQPINTVNSVMGFVALLVSFSTAFFAMAAVSVPVTVLLLASSIPSIIWEGRFNEKVYQFDQEAARERRRMDYLFSLFTDRTAAKEIRTFRAGPYLEEKRRKALEEYQGRYLRLAGGKLRVDGGFWLILQGALMLGYYLVISEVQGRGTAAGSLSFFLTVAVDMQDALRRFGSSFNGVVQGARYFDNLLELERTGRAQEEAFGGRLTPERVETVEFPHVSFRYPGREEEALHDVSFTLRCPPVMLVGMNGSGKSTLLKLLLGFYRPDSGEILINSIPVGEYDREQYYELFSVCFQDRMRYGFSFQENIMMGSPEMDRERFWEIVDQVQLGEVCEKLPEKERTNLLREYDEGGVELSGGQYDRLAIARAVAKEAPVLLLDEPDAALDARAEETFFRIYDRLVEKRLGIMVTHRMQRAVSADVILVLKDGVLVEQGNHRQLMERKGQYEAMFRMQAERYWRNSVQGEAVAQEENLS